MPMGAQTEKIKEGGLGCANRETRLGPRPAILQPISTNVRHGQSFSLDSAGDVTSGRDEKSDQYLEWS